MNDVELAIKITENGKEAAAGIAQTKSSLDGFNDAAANIASTSGKAARALGGISKGLKFVGADGAAKDLQEAGQALQFVKGVAGAAQVATELYTGAQEALNFVLEANPIGLVVLAVAALILGIVLLYKHSETARTIINGALHGIADTAGFVVDFIKDHWKLLLAILLGPIAVAALEIAEHWGQIKDGARAVIDWVQDEWSTLKGDLTAPFTAAEHLISGALDDVISAARSVRDDVGGFFSTIADDVQDVIDKVEDFVHKLDSIKDKVSKVPGLGFLGRTASGTAGTGAGIAHTTGDSLVIHFHGFVGDEAKVYRTIRDGLAADRRRNAGQVVAI